MRISSWIGLLEVTVGDNRTLDRTINLYRIARLRGYWFSLDITAEKIARIEFRRDSERDADYRSIISRIESFSLTTLVSVGADGAGAISKSLIRSKRLFKLLA